jgi:hypothetical protein
MNFDKLVNEIYNTNVNKQFTAYNSPPRKDFAPVSTKDGYHFPYQQGGDKEMEGDQLEVPISYPWQLQTASEDLSNGFISILNGVKKLADSKKNPALNINQKNDINKVLKFSKKILSGIKKIAFKIDEYSDLSTAPTPEVKMNASLNNNPDNLKRTEVKIKLPK